MQFKWPLNPLDSTICIRPHFGLGVPALTNCAAMYCFSSVLTSIPVQLQFYGNVLDRRRTAAPLHVAGEALGIERIVSREIEPLALHAAVVLAVDTPDLDSNPSLTVRRHILR